MPTILITGASSGLGLAFLLQYAHDPNNTLITCDKNPLPAYAPANHTHHILDITSESSILDFADVLKATPIHLLVHSIGIRGLVEHLHTEKEGSAQEAETLPAMDSATMLLTYKINTLGPFLLFRSLVPSLLLARQETGQKAKVVVMTSRMGSVGRNEEGKGGGSAYAYRSSKAGLNTVVRSLAVDVRDVVWVLCHPGRVQSALVRYKETGAISGQESVEGLAPLIDKWSEEDSGGFYDRFGEVIEW